MADLVITPGNVVRASASVAQGIAGVTISAGDVVYLDRAEKRYKLADSDNASVEVRSPRGIALNNASANQPVKVATKGRVTLGAVLTPGITYCLSATPGKICPASDLQGGNYAVLLGIAKTSSSLDLRIQDTGTALDGLSLFSSATETTTNPSTTVMTIAGGYSGFRVWTGEQSISEENFTLYVKKNGGTAYAVQLHRWQARIFMAAPGDTFAFGTSDGRTLRFAQMVVPTSLPSISGATGTANCDKAGPPLWSPSAAHITLPTTSSAFQIDAANAERVIFISEKSPDGTWSPLRWVRHQNGRATKVQCSYREIALANYAGATLAITAPTGTTIGGSNTPMALPIPAVTGTTHNVSTVAQFKTAISAAVSGDAIVAASGTYAFDVEITRASFTANEAAGKKGAEGILIRGATGNRDDVILTGNGTGTNGKWSLIQPGAGAQATTFASFRDFTFDGGAQAIKFEIEAGKYYLENLLFKNGTDADLVDISNVSGPVTVEALNCRVEDGAGDLWNGGSDASGTHNAASRLRMINCEGDQPGAGDTFQCVTSHDGFPMEVWGGTYTDAQKNVFANDSEATISRAFFATISNGTRAAGIVNGWRLFGCEWTQSAGLAGDSVQVLFGHITATKDISTRPIIRNSPSVKHTIITGGVGRGIHNSIASAAIGNIITGCGDAIRNGDAASLQSSSNYLFNTLIGNTNGFNHPTTTNDPAVFNSNAAKTNTTSVNTTAGAKTSLTGDYNVLDATVDADYVAGANDTTGSDAALDSDWFPTASGNCDDNGEYSKLGFVGGSDPFGFVLTYKQNVAPRGARSRPIIRSGAELYPDFY